MHITTLQFFSNRHPIKAGQEKFPTYFDLVCIPQRFICKKCRQLDGAVAGRSCFNCHCEGLLVEIDKSDFYCLLFCESHWPPSVAVNNIVIFMFPLAFLSTPIFVNTNKYQVEKTCWLWFRVYLLPTRLYHQYVYIHIYIQTNI